MKILIETIPHEQQRYPTAGDWWWDREGSEVRHWTLQIRVSELGDWRMEACIAVHEAVEALMCEGHMPPIGQREVDEFDMRYEREREQGEHPVEAEPGDDHQAPYYHQHQIATGIERILASSLGVDWNSYADKIGGLP